MKNTPWYSRGRGWLLLAGILIILAVVGVLVFALSSNNSTTTTAVVTTPAQTANSALTPTVAGTSTSPATTTMAPTTQLATQGATLPYIEYEAEDADTNGAKLGPDRTFTHLASEASGRQAVQLSAQGQYVEFTLTKPANAMILRYSIPDTKDGSGMTAPLSLYVNGTHKSDLTLTSKYSWYYGVYPFTNNPSGFLGHHFYDETHTMLDEMPAGTKVRVQMDAGDTAPSYTIDLADFEEVAAPLTQPDGFLSITDFKADPTGATDSTQAVKDAVAAAKTQNKGVWIPKGTFTVNNHIVLDNITVRGAGMWYSTLHGVNVGLYGNSAPNGSKNVKMYDFAIFSEVMDRNDNAQVNGIGGALGGGSVIQNIWIEHTKVGIWLDGPFDGLTITGVRIHDTTADGINFHIGITNATVEQSDIRNVGDDGLAMWSQNQPDQNDTFRFNTVRLPILANDIAIYGGTNISVTDNYVADSLTEGGGIHVGNRFKSVPLSGTTTIANNKLVRTGAYHPGLHYSVGALWFWGEDYQITGTINVSNTEIDDSTYAAIHFNGQKTTNVTLDHITINKTGTFAIQEQAAGSATFNYVTATGLGAEGQYYCSVGFKVLAGTGNSGWDSIKCGFPPTPTPIPIPSPTHGS